MSIKSLKIKNSNIDLDKLNIEQLKDLAIRLIKKIDEIDKLNK